MPTLANRNCLVSGGQVRDNRACDKRSPADGSGFSAHFWDIPENWMQTDFDDSVWPAAVIYSNDTVDVNKKPPHTNFTNAFDTTDADASVIWSSNLVLDNLMLLRTTIE